MLDLNELWATICLDLPEALPFQPSDVDLNKGFISTTKSDDEEPASVDINEREGKEQLRRIEPVYPKDVQAVGIDATSLSLGDLPDGIVGAVRAALVRKPAQAVNHRLELYGPRLVPITNQNKDDLYKSAHRAVHNTQTSFFAPDCIHTLDRIRALLERSIQLKAVSEYKDSLVLLDGSLIAIGTVEEPRASIKKLLEDANGNGNSVIAVSKSTKLTLQSTKKSILSLLDYTDGPCYIGDVRDYFTSRPGSYLARPDSYLGKIYVARLRPFGTVFRVDIPDHTPIDHDEILSQLAGLAGDYGYPEELRLAHMTCIFGHIEQLELQAAAMQLHGLRHKPDVRKNLFPI